MTSSKITREPNPTDRQTVKELFYTSPMVERGKPILVELKWVLLGRQNAEQHIKILPEYCYHIFDVFQKTYFKGFPLFHETVFIIDQAGFKAAKTIDEAKKVLRLDWKNLGRLVGIAARGIRFFEHEVESTLESDGFDDYTPEECKEIFLIVCGKVWTEAHWEKIMADPIDPKWLEALAQKFVSEFANLKQTELKIQELAYDWSPQAMIEFSEGYAEGLKSLLDESGQPKGASNRSGIYSFLLLAWPEIKVMLEANPKRTLTDLHEWLQPYMRRDLMTYIEIETLRDVCAPPPSGIGLSLRPLKKASA